MNAPLKPDLNFEPRPLYGIGTVARLTGLKPDTLRVWERRYGLRASYKSPSGRRQYTQADLEHLQLIAALVGDGARIGEIADSERKTLEMLVKGRGKHLQKQLPVAKPKVLFIGPEICNVLDQHQGCISGVSALLVRKALADLPAEMKPDPDIAMLVVDCHAPSINQLTAIEEIARGIGQPKILLTYRLVNERWLEELDRRGMQAMPFPPEPAQLAYEMGHIAVKAEAAQGDFDLGELVNPKQRLFSAEELQAASKLRKALNCECPQHIVELIKSLNEFEEYSTQCSIENWEDAAVHSCIYAYTNQARYLMEKALKAVVDERGGEYLSLINAKREQL